jgi:hypothetical protein
MLFSGCGTEDSLEQEPFVNYLERFNIRAPSGWETVEGTSGTLVVFVGPELETTIEKAFVPNIVVGTAGNQDFKLMEIVESARNSIPPGIELIGETSVKLHGRQAYIFESTLSQQGLIIRNLQLIMVRDGKPYFVTATGPEEHWQNLEATLKASLYSFELD